MKKCIVCGCPQISSLYHSFDVHYKNCTNQHKFGRKRIVSKEEWGERLSNCIEILKKNVDYAKEKLLEARYCVKNTCLDEVYECRWDCCIVPEKVRLLN